MSNKLYPNNDIVTSTEQNQLAGSDTISPRTTSIRPTNAELLVGYTGSRGLQGEKGDTGFTGSRGNIGQNGATGPSGPTGIRGPSGPQGSTGLVGFTGSRGQAGTNGTVGFVGSRGQMGPTGLTGPSGEPGQPGQRGSVGFTGSRGINGEKGFTGSAGIGIRGSVGFTGSRGSQGERGDRGFVGSASTAPGFTGSHGDKGFTGSQGIPGTAAAVGFTGSAGGVGFTGSRGLDGQSAAIGYTGSAGSGFTGSAGVGFTGSRGLLGPSGPTGPSGATGPTGPSGSSGPSGTVDWGNVTAHIYPEFDAQFGGHKFDTFDIGDPDDKFFRSMATATLYVGQIFDLMTKTAINIGGGGGSGASTLSELTDVQITTATVGQVLTWNGTKWINNNASTGGGTSTGLSTRSTINFAGGDATINGFKSYAILSIGTSAAAWVRVYTDRPSRTADSTSGRTVNTDPLPSAGILAEVVTNGAEIVRFTPAAIGWNNDSPPNGNIYIRSTNLSNTSGVSGNITILRLEA